ncbi:outer membrane protein [Bradyrhizobium sp. WSM3983]|uniref:outer membrane protein n=1 Tax=Bradyrhizobium sp. WSM3983 TaxID=1038867 RepID=UPI00040C9A17|nr:outer membrane beta-barrel protein [Bradyrhizobium sp. WSM3983]
MRFTKVATFMAFGTIATAAAGLANAADLAARPYTKAPPVPMAVYSWTGCYVGGNVGGGSDRQTYTNVNPNRLPNFDLGSERNTGVIGGGQIGCDYQAGNFVFGAQGMIDATDLRGSNRVVPAPGDPQFPNIFDLSARTSWIATATARIGYTVTPQTLLYVKGGGAWSRSSLDYTITGMGVATFTGSETRSGWIVGGGVEYLLAPNWSVFAEYNHMDFGTSILATQGIGADAGFSEPIRIGHRIDAGMVGVNYRFGGPGPVVAKY